MVELSFAEFNECVGSSDATHISLKKCSYRLRQNNLGGKSKLTTRSFNLNVNHCRWIISTAPGYPSRWNNKTLVLFDDFLREIHEGSLMEDVSLSCWKEIFRGTLIL
jgi:hypothetical protein